MMWEREYIEWAQTAEAGFLSPQEVELNWKLWLKDDSGVKKDDRGPRGFKRVWVEMGTRGATYRDQGVSREAVGVKAAIKKANAAQAAAFAAFAKGNVAASNLLRMGTEDDPTKGLAGHLFLGSGPVTRSDSEG